MRVVQRRRHRRLVRVFGGLDRPLVLPHPQPVSGDDERAPAVVPQGGRYGIVRPVHSLVLEALKMTPIRHNYIIYIIREGQHGWHVW